MPLRNPANNIIPEHQREIFIQTVFGGVGDLLRLGKGFSEALTKRQQQQKPVIEAIGDVFLDHVGNFEPFIRYSGNKVFATFEHERQQQVNIKYARFLDAIEKKPESKTRFVIFFDQRCAKTSKISIIISWDFETYETGESRLQVSCESEGGNRGAFGQN